jgi:hypothetical protein
MEVSDFIQISINFASHFLCLIASGQPVMYEFPDTGLGPLKSLKQLSDERLT